MNKIPSTKSNALKDKSVSSNQQSDVETKKRTSLLEESCNNFYLFPRCEYFARYQETSYFIMDVYKYHGVYHRTTKSRYVKLASGKATYYHPILNPSREGRNPHSYTGTFRNPYYHVKYQNALKQKQQSTLNLINKPCELIYDTLLLYKQKMCGIVVREFNMQYASNELKVKVYWENNYPCVMVNLCSLFGGVTKTFEHFSRFLMGYFIGIVNYRANLAGIHIEIVVRSSFGHNLPSVDTVRDFFRINVGLIPSDYATLLAKSLIELCEAFKILLYDSNDLVQSFIEQRNDMLDKVKNSKVNHWNSKDTWQEILSKIGNEQNSCFIAELTRKNYRVSLLSGYVEDDLEQKGVLSMSPTKKMIELLEFELKPNAKKSGQKVSTTGERYKEQAKIRTKNYLTKPKNTLDQEFQDLLTKITSHLGSQLPFDLKLLYAALEKANLDFASYALSQGINTHNRIKIDPGSDSDTESKIERTRISSKKIVVSTGMMAINLGLYIARFFLKTIGITEAEIIYEIVYFETKELLPLLINQANIAKKSTKSPNKILCYDLNYCQTKLEENYKNNFQEILQKNKPIVVLLDHTSATSYKIKNHIQVALIHDVKLILLANSGLKNEQCGADHNPYGVLRILAKSRPILNSLYNAAISTGEGLPSMAHQIRRLYKQQKFALCSKDLVDGYGFDKNNYKNNLKKKYQDYYDDSTDEEDSLSMLAYGNSVIPKVSTLLYLSSLEVVYSQDIRSKYIEERVKYLAYNQELPDVVDIWVKTIIERFIKESTKIYGTDIIKANFYEELYKECVEFIDDHKSYVLSLDKQGVEVLEAHLRPCEILSNRFFTLIEKELNLKEEFQEDVKNYLSKKEFLTTEKQQFSLSKIKTHRTSCGIGEIIKKYVKLYVEQQLTSDSLVTLIVTFFEEQIFGKENDWSNILKKEKKYAALECSRKKILALFYNIFKDERPIIIDRKTLDSDHKIDLPIASLKLNTILVNTLLLNRNYKRARNNIEATANEKRKVIYFMRTWNYCFIDNSVEINEVERIAPELQRDIQILGNSDFLTGMLGIVDALMLDNLDNKDHTLASVIKNFLRNEKICYEKIVKPEKQPLFVKALIEFIHWLFVVEVVHYLPAFIHHLIILDLIEAGIMDWRKGLFKDGDMIWPMRIQDSHNTVRDLNYNNPKIMQCNKEKNSIREFQTTEEKLVKYWLEHKSSTVYDEDRKFQCELKKLLNSYGLKDRVYKYVRRDATNQYNNIEYEYQLTDIQVLGSQLFHDTPAIIFLTCTENKEQLQKAVRDKLPLLKTGKALVGVCSVATKQTNMHWVAFIVFRSTSSPDIFDFFIKDSLGREHQELATIIASELQSKGMLINLPNERKFSTNVEQQIESAASGIYALENSVILGHCSKEFETLEFFKFSPTNTEKQQRTKYATLYAKSSNKQKTEVNKKPHYSIDGDSKYKYLKKYQLQSSYQHDILHIAENGDCMYNSTLQGMLRLQAIIIQIDGVNLNTHVLTVKQLRDIVSDYVNNNQCLYFDFIAYHIKTCIEENDLIGYPESMQTYLQILASDHTSQREEAIEYSINNILVEQYMNLMRNSYNSDSEIEVLWGGEVELGIISKVFGIQIYIYKRNICYHINNTDNPNAPRINLDYTGNHYNLDLTKIDPSGKGIIFSSYWHEYTFFGLLQILYLRLQKLNLTNKVKIIEEALVWQGAQSSINRLTNAIANNLETQTVLVPLNLFYKHWVGLVIEKQENQIKLTYIDSEKEDMSGELKTLLLETLKSRLPDYTITLEIMPVAHQSYGNCGLELVENFIQYLTGDRLEEDDVSVMHSQLLEQYLTNSTIEPLVISLAPENKLSYISRLAQYAKEYRFDLLIEEMTRAIENNDLEQAAVILRFGGRVLINQMMLEDNELVFVRQARNLLENQIRELGANADEVLMREDLRDIDLALFQRHLVLHPLGPIKHFIGENSTALVVRELRVEENVYREAENNTQADSNVTTVTVAGINGCGFHNVGFGFGAESA